MIAQIRTSLWVRNGFAIRGQLLHYRDFMLRELCYDQDIFILQTALIILDPNTVIVSILDRFGLLSYFCGAILNCVYEGVQLSSMVEEVLYLFITLFSENANASKMPLRVAVRREIVHALAMGPCSFTDLVKRVAERMVDDVCFEPVLKEVANFKPPDSTTDTGVYELKDEAFDEVNPFFYHYTRNKREEVEIILHNRLKKKTGLPDPVIVPKSLGIEKGPFSTLTSSFESEALLQVMFYAIYNVLVLTDSTGTTPPSAEAILDQSLHLVMLALVERPSIFSRLAGVRSFEEGKNIIDIICALEHHEKYKPYSARVDWILARMEECIPEEVQARRRVLETNRTKYPDPEDAKKRAAKNRQEAIMKQMKAQQASFAFNFDDEDEDEDMEETPEEHVSYGTCIVCQEDLNGSRHFGGLGLLQPSRLIRRHPDSHNMYLNEVLLTSASMDRCTTPPCDSSFPPLDAHNRDMKSAASSNFEGFPAQYTRFGLYASTCGHMMHLDCFQTYSMSIRQRHRSQATRNHPENISRKEFICPLCKSLGNVLLPVTHPTVTTLSGTPFPDWIRAAGIGILKSRPDPVLDSLQFRNGTGEFAFWSAQDPGYVPFLRLPGNEVMPEAEIARMVDSIMVVSKSVSQQTRHLRDRPEPEPGERGAGIYLPEELLGYTIAGMETAHRGTESQGGVVDALSDQQFQMVRGLLACLTKMAAMQLKGRADGGRDAIRQAIIKRLLPEWSRTSLTSFSYPLLLRDPFTVLVETAAVAPEMIRHVLILTYYACLARTVIGLVYVLNKTRSYSTVQIGRRNHEDIFGDVRMFFMSVVRHSPVFEHTATLVFETFGEARIEKLLYAFTLPFLRRAAILCRSVLPSAFPTPSFGSDEEPCEYNRLLTMLGIPPLSDLPNQDTLQNALSGWCAHYGHSHAASQLNCGVVLDYPAVYQIARLPIVLDNLFGGRDKAMKCARCNTVPIDAAICLICGTTCCFQSHCCTDIDANQRGECNMHTREYVTFFIVVLTSCSYVYTT